MAYKNRRCRQTSSPQHVQSGTAGTYSEPPMRRWSHPVTAVPAQEESELHYIYCALSYQNQLLADIKVLLEQLVTDVPSHLVSNSATVSYEKK